MTTNVKTKSRQLSISRADELRILRQLVDLTSSEPDLNLVLNEVVKIVYAVTRADSVFIYLFDEKAEHLVLRASKTPHEMEIGKLTLKLGEGIAGWVVRENKPVAINEKAYADRRFKTFDNLQEDRYEAIMSVAINRKGKPIGVINVQHKKVHLIAQETVSILSTIGKLIGGVIENARLYEEKKHKAMQFDSLVKVSQTITSEKYLDEILNLIVVVTAEMLNSKICSIMLLDEKRQELSIKATQSLSEEYKKKPNIKVSKSLSGEVIATGEPLAVYDVRKEAKYAYRDLAAKEDLTSMLSVPMAVKDKTIGVISIYTKKFHVFTQEEIDVLQMVANQAAVAIENTKLMEEAIKAKEALETRKLIERAKGVLMRLNQLDEQTAYRIIHKKSMDSCKTMKEIAESILLMDELQKK